MYAYIVQLNDARYQRHSTDAPRYTDTPRSRLHGGDYRGVDGTLLFFSTVSGGEIKKYVVCSVLVFNLYMTGSICYLDGFCKISLSSRHGCYEQLLIVSDWLEAFIYKGSFHKSIFFVQLDISNTAEDNF